MKTSDAKWYFKELQSNECLCGDYKNPGKSFCYWCHNRLPREMQNALYQQIGNGYEEALDDAVKYLELGDTMIEFNSRKTKDRRKTPCYIEKDRRANPERRGRAARQLKKKQRKEFERHLNAQR